MLTSKIFKNTFWMLFEKVVMMGGNLLITIFLARMLGTKDFGTINYFLALIAIIAPLSSLGMNSILTRDVINFPQDKSTIFSSATAMRAVGSLIGVALLLIVGILFLDINDKEYFYLVILTMLSITSAFQGLEFWFQSEVNMKPVIIARLFIFVVFSVLKFIVVYLHLPLVFIISVFGLELFFTGLGYWIIFVIKGGALSFRHIDFTYCKKLFKKASWLMLSSIAAVIYLKIDQVMLAEMSSREQVGIYSVAVRLSEVWYFIAIALVSSIFPSLLKSKNKNESVYYEKLQYTCDLLCWIAIFLAIFVQLVSDYFVPLIFGQEYSGSSVILSIHVWSGVFVFMRALASKWILAEDCLHVSLISQGAGAIINVVLNLILIPKYQATGAAIATLMSYSISGFLIFYFSSRTRPMANVMFNSLFMPILGIKRYKFILRKFQ
jgi:O-antigen/teichoic acid export membrane protein